MFTETGQLAMARTVCARAGENSNETNNAADWQQMTMTTTTTLKANVKQTLWIVVTAAHPVLVDTEWAWAGQPNTLLEPWAWASWSRQNLSWRVDGSVFLAVSVTRNTFVEGRIVTAVQESTPREKLDMHFFVRSRNCYPGLAKLLDVDVE